MIHEDPQPEEKTIPLDEHVKELEWLSECSENIAFWTAKKEEAQAALAAIMGDATVGTLKGQQVITYRFQEKFRGEDFKRFYPDTWRSFYTDVTRKQFDVKALQALRPDLYDQFRVRAMKSTYKKS